jgi:hypothetical protein
MKKLFIFLLAVSGFAHAEPAHKCSAEAVKQAKRLLVFHLGQSDDRIEVDEMVKALPSIRNPVNKNQSFDVLEVWGYVYKGKYRMHFMYAQLKDECLLMGQEILEYANL